MSSKNLADKSTQNRIRKVNEKAFGFLCKTSNKNEKANIITIAVLVAISSIIYFLYYCNVITFDMNKLLFDFIPVVPLLILNLPGTLLLVGFYFLINFSKCDEDENNICFSIIGIAFIMMAIIICLMSSSSMIISYIPNDSCLVISNFVSVVSITLVFIFIFGIKKVPYFSVRQLIVLFLSNVICVGLFIIIIIVLTIVFTIIVVGIGLGASSDGSYSSSSSSSGSSNQKYKIKRDEADPTKGVLLDDNENVLRKDNGNPVKVTNIDEYSHTAKVDGEEVKIEGE